MKEPETDTYLVTVEDGLVMIDGVGVALTLTAEVATDLADQLHAGVVVALSQQAFGSRTAGSD